jgi:hypothetical protein
VAGLLSGQLTISLALFAGLTAGAVVARFANAALQDRRTEPSGPVA